MLKQFPQAILFIVTLCVVGTSAQIKELTTEEFYAAKNAAIEASRSVNRRAKTIERTFKKGKVVSSSTETDEFLMPDRHRSCLLLTDSKGRKIESETIRINSERYSRGEDGIWRAIRSRRTGNLFRNETSATVGVSSLYTSESALFGGDEVTIIKSIQNDKLPVPSTLTIYIEKSGLLLRMEFTQKFGEQGDLERITTYEYDPKDLKIEAPVK